MAATNPIKMLHYNIKELDSTKIALGNTRQLIAVKNILAKYDFDILSLNEVQYDFKNIPSPYYLTNGKNIKKLMSLWGLNNFQGTSFYPANTGKNAKPKVDGTYYVVPNSAMAREHADPLNFGTMPGQYSTGAVFKHKVVTEKIITDLKWKDFNPAADFSTYKTANGDSFPNDMLLFDKNFSDLTIEHDGKMVHIILLHTVPSYHFGNPHSINDYRNAEQLRFLEWYTTGATDYPVTIKGTAPLKKNTYFITMGDLNVGVNDTSSEGSQVLKSIFAKTNTWLPISEMNFTNEGGGFGPKPLRLMLDYIFASKNITPQNGKIIHPDFKRVELGCEPSMPNKSGAELITKEYKNEDNTCKVNVTKEYVDFKLASDHYPLYGEFILQ